MLLPGPDDMDREILAIVKETPGKDYLILDVRDARLSFSSLVMLLADARSEIKEMGGKAFIDENMEYLFVGDGDLTELAVKALEQEQYGSIEARLFATIKEALAYARAEINRE